MTTLPQVAMTSRVPTITILACGGFGIKTARRFASSAKIDGEVAVKYLDNSHANVKPGEQCILLTEHGSGSGKVRATNVDDVSQNVARLTDDMLNLGDINIIIHSLDGGSGSVIGPLLLGALLDRDRERSRRYVLIAVADGASHLSAINTKKTISSYTNITTKRGFYLPTALFTNAVGESVADDSIQTLLANLVNIMTSPAADIDRNDRMNMLAPNIALPDLEAGLHPMVAFSMEPSEIQGHLWALGSSSQYVDSLMVLAGANSELSPSQSIPDVFQGTAVGIKFTGKFTVSGRGPMTMVVGGSVSLMQDMVENMTSTADQHRKINRKSLAVDSNSSRDDGMDV